jgi:hypothetical protein
MLLIKNPLTYFALVLFIGAFYFFFTKRSIKANTTLSSRLPWSPVGMIVGASSLFDKNFPPENKQIIIPRWERNLFGAFFLAAGLAVLACSYLLTYQVK